MPALPLIRPFGPPSPRERSEGRKSPAVIPSAPGGSGRSGRPRRRCRARRPRRSSTTQPAFSIAALVLGKPATAITWCGAVGRTLRLRPLDAANSSASPSDQPDAAFAKQLVEGSRQQRRMDQRQIVGERADHRHQMQAGFLAVPERQVEAEDRRRRCGPSISASCSDAGLVGPDAAPDGQRLGVDPDAIAALDRARRLDAAEDRNAHACVGGLMQRRLRAAAVPCPSTG